MSQGTTRVEGSRNRFEIERDKFAIDSYDRPIRKLVFKFPAVAVHSRASRGQE